jgi:hypothetical protein
MYLREFIFMEIEFVSKRANLDATVKACDSNCLEKTRKKITELFVKADC